MKRIFTSLLLLISLSGLLVAAEIRDSATRSEVTSISLLGNTVHPSSLQNNNGRRRRWRRRWNRRNRRHARRWNRRWNRRGGGGHETH